MASAIDVRIDDVGSILKFRIGFPFGGNSAGFCQSVWLLESILNFRIGSVSSIGGLIAATLFADTISDSQIHCLLCIVVFVCQQSVVTGGWWPTVALPTHMLSAAAV